ncbi:MAG: DUF1707 domain-containing protein [Acidimicrobiales bacterium]
MSDPNPQGDQRLPWEHLYTGGPWHDVRKRTASLRIGDTDRAELAEVLGKHYSDGRLDDEEFRERMDRAMSAKTRGDLGGLLSDLPPLGPTPNTLPVPRHSRRLLTLVVVFAGLVFASTLPWRYMPLHVSWVFFGIVAFVLLYRHDRHRRFMRHSSRS